MCDTMWKQLDSGIIFAKNSDRGCNEPNLTVFIKGGIRNEKEVQCTYISIPQVKQVNSILLVKPSWIWGAEMGINEFGVAIGNEAVFTKSKSKKIEKLLGMDILRLALERSSSASQALNIIIELLETYGQGANCGFDKNFYYDNSFLITDKQEGYIIETAGKKYVVKKLQNCGNISNRLSVDENFTKANSEPIFTFFSGSKERKEKGFNLISKSKNIKDVFNVLRSHNDKVDKKLYTKGSVKSICMHQSMLGDQTTGSMVVHYGKQTTIWITGSSSPCMSIFKPVVFGDIYSPVFSSDFDSCNYWLKREYLSRAIFSGYIDVEVFQKNANILENEFITEINNAINENVNEVELSKICKNCSDREEEFINSYNDIIEKVKNRTLK